MKYSISKNKMNVISLVFLGLHLILSGVVLFIKTALSTCFQPLLNPVYFIIALSFLLTILAGYKVIQTMLDKKVNNPLNVVGIVYSAIVTILVIASTVLFFILVRSIKSSDNVSCGPITDVINISNYYFAYGVITSVYSLIIAISWFIRYKQKN